VVIEILKMKLKRSQYQHTPPTEVELAWISGIWEGEGCWQYKKARDRCNHRNGKIYTAKPEMLISIQMTDKDIVDRVAKIMDNRTPTFTHTPKKKALGWKPLYTFSIRGKAAVLWTNLMKPYLGKRRMEKLKRFMKTLILN
jgi:hypothetical protein